MDWRFLLSVFRFIILNIYFCQQIFYNSFKHVFSLKTSYGFRSSSTANEVALSYQSYLKDKTILITGGNSGIGYEVVDSLLSIGCKIIVLCRNNEKTKIAINNLNLKHNNKSNNLRLISCDLSNFNEILTVCKQIISEKLPITILINNAGIAWTPPLCNRQDIELNFATNCLGHMILTYHLLPLLYENALKYKVKSRIINVSSSIHTAPEKLSKNFPNWEYISQFHKAKEYNQPLSYGFSKLGNILHMFGLIEYMKKKDDYHKMINVYCLHPGNIATPIIRHKTPQLNNFVQSIQNDFLMKIVNFIARLKTPQQGAATTVFIAGSPHLENITGKYFVDCDEHPISPLAKNQKLAQSLFDFSLKYC